MKMTIESTDRIVKFEDAKGFMTDARLWVGLTEKGVPVECLIVLVAAPGGEDNSELERDLKEYRPAPSVGAFDLRHVL